MMDSHSAENVNTSLDSPNQNPTPPVEENGKLEITHDDVDIEDRCWTPQYKSDSRKWILKDGHATEKLSTMKESFMYPKKHSPVIGRRAKILLDKMLHEAEMEAVAQRAGKPTVEEYITTYDGTYCSPIPGFIPKPPPRSRDLYEKYPLYQNQANTFWQYAHMKNIGTNQHVPGMTIPTEANNPFKKNSHFSKPMEEEVNGTLQK